MPSLVAAGAGAAVAASPGDLAVPFPAGLVAGDLLIAQLCLRDNTSTLDTVPSGWSLIASPDSQSSTIRQWVYWKYSDGTETGTETWSSSGTTVFYGRMYAVRNPEPTGFFAESGGFVGANSSSFTHTAITTPSADRLAVAFLFQSDDNTLAEFTGETGGDWTVPVADYTTILGSDGALGIQTAALPAAGTLTGGAFTSSASDPWGVRCFAIRPLFQARHPVINHQNPGVL